MFKSLKNWINLPAQIRPFLSRTGTGLKTYGALVDILCYAEGKVELIKDSSGVEVVSNSRLYVDGLTNISVLDMVIFEGKEAPIQNIGSFYRKGTVDIKVVYL